MTSSKEDTIRLERRIAAPPEVVFSYFTDPMRYRQWQGADAELEPHPGGKFRVTVTGKSKAVASGVYLEVDPPNRVVFTWGWEQRDWLPDGMRIAPGMSTVEVELERDGDGTILRLRHGDLPTADACEFHTSGWDISLDRLVLAAEGQDSGPDPFAEL